MIKPKHPLECYNIHQEIFIKHTIEKDQEYYILRISYENAVYLYYKLQTTISPYDYRKWLNGIDDENFKRNMLAKGFKACKNSFSFIRFIKSKRNIAEQDYIKKIMGADTRYKILCQIFK